MAADGNKKMKAKLDVDPCAEMKADTKKWVQAFPKAGKLYSKKIVYEETLELNPKKWTANKLSSAMKVLVRAELQLLAARVVAAKKLHEKDKPEKDVVAVLEKAHKDITTDIEEKCSEALDDLASGKGAAAAALTLGKKTMAQINTLNIDSTFKTLIDSAEKTAKDLCAVLKKGDAKDSQNAFAAAKKKIEPALKELGQTGKQAEAVARYLLDTGKKLKDHELGPLDAFGKKLRHNDVQTPLENLVNGIEKLEDEISRYIEDLKESKMNERKVSAYQSSFAGMKGLQKVANDSLKEMKKLEKQFKAIEKDLK